MPPCPPAGDAPVTKILKHSLKINRQEKCSTNFLVIVAWYMRKLRSFENFAKIYARLEDLLSFEKRITQNLSSRRMTSSSN